MKRISPKKKIHNFDSGGGLASLGFFRKRNEKKKYATPSSVYGSKTREPEVEAEVAEESEEAQGEAEEEPEVEADEPEVEADEPEVEADEPGVEAEEPGVEPEPELEPPKKKKKSRKQMQKEAEVINKSVKNLNNKAYQENKKMPLSYNEETALKHMNIMTCKDMKNYLNDTKLSLDQQIEFLQQNTKGHRELRAYWRSQHYGVKEMTFFVQTSNFVRKTFATNMQEAIESFSPDNSDSTDPDCIEMDALLIKLKKQKEALKNSEDWWNWTKTTGWKALSLLWEGFKGTVNLTGKGLYWIGAGIYYVFSTIAQMGFDLWDWITKDPKTAKYVLISLKLLKKRSCRFIGKIIREKNLITKEELATRYRSTVEMGRAKPPEDILWDANNEIAQDIFFRATSATVVKSFKELAEPVGKYLGGSISLLLGGGAAVATVATGGAAGVAIGALGAAGAAGGASKLGEFLGMCTGKIVEVAVGETADAVEDAIELGVFIKDQDTCFSLLFELIDPNACLKDMLKEYNQTEFNYRKKEEEAKEKKEQEEIKAAREKETPEERKVNDKKRAEIQKKKDDEKKQKIQKQVDKEVEKAGFFGGTWLRTKNFFSPQKELKFDEDEAYDELLKNKETKADGNRNAQIKRNPQILRLKSIQIRKTKISPKKIGKVCIKLSRRK